VTTEKIVRYSPRGAVRDLFYEHSTETLIEGAAGTGKTRGICEYLHLVALRFPGSRQLMCRKTNTALTTAALATFQGKVLQQGDPCQWFGGSKSEPAAFRYDNGSRIVVGGLDNLDKTLSTEYDNVYVNEATELDEDSWEMLLRCLRNGITPHQRLIGDCNPATDRHWLLRRCNTGRTKRLHSTIRDNPAYWDEATGDYTETGRAYVEDTLGGLSGTRRQRLIDGLWVGMENAIYDILDPSIHLRKLPDPVAWQTGAMGTDYGRVHLSAVCAVQRDTTGIYWVRDGWAETGGNLQQIKDAVNSLRSRFRISRGRCDPIQEVLAQELGFSVAKGSAGSRKARIELVYDLLAKGQLYFDSSSQFVRDLFDEMLAYRWEIHENDTNKEKVPVRKDDDRVAALEYAIEELTATYTGPAIRTISIKRLSDLSPFKKPAILARSRV
jgi:phage terminase large subunit